MAFASSLFNRMHLLSGLILALTLVSRATGDELGSQYYEKAKAATVEILVNGHLNGTGWIADSKGLLMTAGHVVENPDR